MKTELGVKKKSEAQRFVFGQLLKHAANKDSQRSKHVLERNKKTRRKPLCALRWILKATVHRQTFKAMLKKLSFDSHSQLHGHSVGNTVTIFLSFNTQTKSI